MSFAPAVLHGVSHGLAQFSFGDILRLCAGGDILFHAPGGNLALLADFLRSFSLGSVSRMRDHFQQLVLDFDGRTISLAFVLAVSQYARLIAGGIICHFPESTGNICLLREGTGDGVSNSANLEKWSKL